MLGISKRFDKFTDMLDAFVGRGKGLGNEQLNAWTVSLLHVQPEDRILEIGCGPGVGIQHAAILVQQGWIAGVDISLDMVQKARRRNLAAIHNGRVELLEGDIARLPYIDNTFDKAFSVNCVPFWPRVIDNLSVKLLSVQIPPTLDVDTADRVVMLTGEVRTEAERDRALQLARETPGVRSVLLPAAKIRLVHARARAPAWTPPKRPGVKVPFARRAGRQSLPRVA